MTNRSAADVEVGEQLPPLELDVTARTVVMGASASRDWQPQHHDHHWAMDKVGTDIFLNTPTQAGWIERFLTDWAGPASRLGRLTFRMRRTVTPRDVLRFEGTVEAVEADATGTGWVKVAVTLTAEADGEAETATECTARLAVPTEEVANPWAQRGGDWRPAGDGAPDIHAHPSHAPETDAETDTEADIQADTETDTDDGTRGDP